MRVFRSGEEPCNADAQSAIRNPQSAIGIARAKLLSHLTPRQVAIAAAYLDGFTQSQIAFEWRIDQGQVSRDLDAVREACRRIGRELPAPRRVHAAREVQLTDRMCRSLGI